MNASETLRAVVDRLEEKIDYIGRATSCSYAKVFAEEPTTTPPLDSDEPLTVEWCEEWLESLTSSIDEDCYLIRDANKGYAGFVLVIKGGECFIRSNGERVVDIKTPNELRYWMYRSKIQHRVTEGLCDE